MGAEAFAGRAAREVVATGARVPTRGGETQDPLIAQETRVALLAREGRSNAEIAAQLFISRSTVEYHLGKVFAKLRISSRRELDRVLARHTEAEPLGRPV